MINLNANFQFSLNSFAYFSTFSALKYLICHHDQGKSNQEYCHCLLVFPSIFGTS